MAARKRRTMHRKSVARKTTRGRKRQMQHKGWAGWWKHMCSM